ncbi:MAG: alpha/beta hydrolase [Saccharofermentans sp.]|nr:alpha/beta hydrolase [Saccharofermentans sp.]
MPFTKRIKLSLITAVIAAFLGSFLILLLSSSIRGIALFILISAAVVFVISFITNLILEGKPSKVRIPVFIVIGFLSVIIVMSTTIYQIGSRMMLMPHVNSDSIARLDTMHVEEINYDGLYGWRIPANTAKDGEKRPVILYFGGNGEDSATMVLNILNDDRLAFLHDAYDFIFIDYPGYGYTTGVCNDDNIRDFTVSAYEYVERLETTGSITVMGYSMGTGAATYLASTGVIIDQVILVAPYANTYDLFNNVIDIFHGPLRLLVSVRMDSDRYATEVKCPVTIFASTTDEVIPIESSRYLFTRFTNNITDFVTFDGLYHNDFFYNDEFINSLSDLLYQVPLSTESSTEGK